jgi:hypothetical protein
MLHLLMRFAEVPLKVLPGGKSEFRSFVSKVIFGHGEGTVAGVRDAAAVSVRVEGLPTGEGEGKGGEGDGDGDERTGRGVDGGLVLMGLPFQESVRVRRKGLR